jgi:hypothetical protein
MFNISRDLLRNAIKIDQNVSGLYLPGFKVRVDQRPLNYMNGYKLEENKFVSKAYESMEMNVWSTAPYDAYFEPVVEQDAIIVDKPFLIGIIHEQLSD